MDDDLIPPGDIPSVSQADDSGSSGGGLTVRTMNLNMGAVRVGSKRNLPAVLGQIEQLAQLFGAGWEYQIPFKNKRKGTTDLVRGPTVGCTQAVARAFGNCTTGVVDVKEVGNAWVFDGVFIDIETGFQLIRPFRQRKSANIGGYGGDQDRAEDILFQIGASKATRNVISNAIGDLVDRGVDMAKNALTDRIAKSRDAVLERIRGRFDEYSIDEAQVRKFYHRSVIEDLTNAELAQVVKALQAVADGNVKASELWGEDVPSTVKEEIRQGMPAETVAGKPASQGETKTTGRTADQQQDQKSSGGSKTSGDPKQASTAPGETSLQAIRVAGKDYVKPGAAANALIKLVEQCTEDGELDAFHGPDSSIGPAVSALPDEHRNRVALAVAQQRNVLRTDHADPDERPQMPAGADDDDGGDDGPDMFPNAA